ncbi:MAG: hypothetical protein U0441_36650 [Polyangiaceae bacterium]
MTRRLPLTALLSACLFVPATACVDNSHPIQPTHPPALPKPPAPKPPAPPPARVPAVPLPDEPEPAPGPLAEPLPALSRTFREVPLPNVKNGIGSLTGSAADDLWFIAGTIVNEDRQESGVVWRYDGKTAKSYGHPCSFANWWSVAAAKGTVVATGYRGNWARGVLPIFRATMSADGKWTCDYRDFGFRAGDTFATRDQVFELTCADVRECSFQVAGGHPVPFPTIQAVPEGRPENEVPPYSAIHMLSASDGFLVHEGDDFRDWLFRYNGVTWRPLAPLTDSTTATGLWADREGHAWILVRSANANEDAPADSLLRWDGQKLAYMAVPETFKAISVHGTRDDDVWITAPEDILYQWDGAHLRRGKAPISVASMWGGADGDLYLGGSELHPKEGVDPAGRLAHTGPRAEAKK